MPMVSLLIYVFILIIHIEIYVETQSTIMMTSMNERTHFIKIYLSHFILERVDVGCV